MVYGLSEVSEGNALASRSVPRAVAVSVAERPAEMLNSRGIRRTRAASALGYCYKIEARIGSRCQGVTEGEDVFREGGTPLFDVLRI